jgi:hypothetical protein
MPQRPFDSSPPLHTDLLLKLVFDVDWVGNMGKSELVLEHYFGRFYKKRINQ